MLTAFLACNGLEQGHFDQNPFRRRIAQTPLVFAQQIHNAGQPVGADLVDCSVRVASFGLRKRPAGSVSPREIWKRSKLRK